MDETTIPAASLIRVLEGAAVATKAPDNYVQPWATWLRQYGVAGGNDSPLGVSAADNKVAMGAVLSFGEWRNNFESCSEYNTEGVQQLAQIVLAVALLRERSRRNLGLDSECLDTISGLVFEAIINAESTQLTFSVNRSAQGFLAVPLCSLLSNGRIEELWRFHTWAPDGQRGIDEEVCIHAHQPFGQSWILLGSGTDYTYEVDAPEDLSLTTHAAYQCCYASTDGKQTGSGYQTHQMSSTIRPTDRLLRLTPGPNVTHTRDMTYSVHGGAYHRSVVSGKRLHATFFAFDSERGYDDDASVLGPKSGSEYIQLRDPAGITPIALAQMAKATRKWEQRHDVASDNQEEHPTVLAYYQFFRGLGHLRAGRREDAMRYLSPSQGPTPLQSFAREPTAEHRDYIKQLVAVGADMTAADEAGCTALDYARQSGDAETVTLISDVLGQNQ